MKDENKEHREEMKNIDEQRKRRRRMWRRRKRRRNITHEDGGRKSDGWMENEKSGSLEVECRRRKTSNMGLFHKVGGRGKK